MTMGRPDYVEQLDRISAQIPNLAHRRVSGKLIRVSGLIMEVVGLKLALGAHCWVEQAGGEHKTEAKVVGFSGNHLLLMPLGETAGLLPGARVWTETDHPGGHGDVDQVPVGPALLGRVVDARGRPLDGDSLSSNTDHAPRIAPAINPLERAPIDTVLDVGIRAINGLLTVGQGQRLGLFAGSGVGKSVLLGMMAGFTEADVIVVGLIGERGREVKDFIDNILGETLSRAVVVAAPADVSPLLWMQGADYATRIAEDFRDRGDNVLLIMDSLTRYAMAQREIALAVGEPPATKGYPPSVFARLPALVERAGNAARGGGSITAFYTVLTEGDDLQDPIADSARAILDGHIVLSRALAETGHYPAIDVESSISRVMTALIDQSHIDHVHYFKRLYSRYAKARDLIALGEYRRGEDAELDRAVNLQSTMANYLRQSIHEHSSFSDAQQRLVTLFETPTS